MRRILRLLLLGTLVVAGAAGGAASLVTGRWSAEAVEVADAHVNLEVAHPGWSFPARVRTAAVPLKGTPAPALVREARARGYREDCDAARSGVPASFCAKRGKERVVPRSGVAALEPLELGVLLGPDGELREHLPLRDAPKVLVDAIRAAEDRAFADHDGVNWRALGRAVFANARDGGYSQGASTLTMQVVRNLSQRKDKTAARKIREVVEARAVDAHLGKDGILQVYLDAPYLGQWGSVSICGFKVAARHYFGKEVDALTLAEAATLAAILPAPGRFAPDRAPERARERRDRVLRAMAETYGYDVAEALAAPVETVPPTPLPERFGAYVGATRAWLLEKLGPDVLYGAGLEVTVAMDVAAQLATEETLRARTAWFDETLVTVRAPAGPDGFAAPLQAAGALLDPETGAIRALYAGSDATSTSFNRATQARRQPGSAFKPLTYALAFEARDAQGRPRYTSASTQPNAPRTFTTPQGTWSPRNVGGEYTPTACLAYGLAWSQNIATAGLLEELGGPPVLRSFAGRFGFDTTNYREEMGLCLGQAEVTPLEMAQFVATIANGGRRVRATPVLAVVDAAGRSRIGPPEGSDVQVVSSETAALTRELMRLVVDIGTGGAARGAGGWAGMQGPLLGKTGTTDQEKDLWFVGATPRHAASLWLGYDTPTPLGLAASDLAAPLWGWWIHDVTVGEAAAATFPATPEVVFRGVCAETGLAPNASCRGIRAPFLPGTAPRGGCDLEHPPPEPEPEEGELDPETGKPRKRRYESVWKRRARAQEEAGTADE